jgi:hypothetical protein
MIAWLLHISDCDLAHAVMHGAAPLSDLDMIRCSVMAVQAREAMISSALCDEG